MPALDLSSYTQGNGMVSDGAKFGNMLTAVQTAVNGLDNANIAAAAGILLSKLAQAGATTGQAIVWSGTAWAPASVGVKTTASLFSGGPPGGPADGDVWQALAVDTGNLATTAGIDWTFRYNASSGSASKWEFIGGSPIQVESAATNATASYTTTRAGRWRVTWGGASNVASGGDASVIMRQGGATQQTGSSSGNSASGAGIHDTGDIATSTVLDCHCNGTTSQNGFASIAVVPVRIT